METTYTDKIEKLKHFWTSRYKDCENETQQKMVRAQFCKALAEFYERGPYDQDIIDEVRLELDT
jgi:hypothetical protein